jgi:hypothetical protein
VKTVEAVAAIVENRSNRDRRKRHCNFVAPGKMSAHNRRVREDAQDRSKAAMRGVTITPFVELT